MLNLLYVTMNAIRRGKQDLRLVRCIFELRTITISGEAPQMFSCMECSTKENLTVFSLRDSAIYCPNCGKTIRDPWPLQPGYRAGMPLYHCGTAGEAVWFYCK